MIVRGGNRTVTDLGPAPARIAGIYAVNTIATAPETHVAPVERRYLSREELARIHEDDALLDPQPVPVNITLPVKVRAPKPVPTPNHQLLAEAAAARAARAEAVWEALRSSGGNVAGAAALLGKDRSRVRYAIHTHTPPADVVELLAHPARGNLGWAVGNHSHTTEARALISLRLREYHARKRAAA